MLQQKEAFLKNELIPLLKSLQPGQKGRWGKMDAQQMVEHLRDVCKVANGKIILPLVNTDPARLERDRAFIMTELPFRENTRVPVMPEEPRPHKYANIHEAITKLQPELEEIFTVYASDPAKTTHNPMFGELDYMQQVNLLYKHITHHLRQFGLVP